MDVRLIASDLDGTMFGAAHQPEQPTVEALNAAVDAGIVVVAATGRSWFGGAGLATGTGARLDAFIGSNGGHRLNLATDVVEERIAFPATVVRSLLDELTQLGDVGLGFELIDGMVWSERFAELSPSSHEGRHRVPSPIPFDRFDEVGKVFLAHPEVSRVELVDLVAPLVPVDVNVTTSGSPFIEMTPPGADKGAAVARYAALLGIEREQVIAFGDNQNDLSLIRWAGHGVAMGNALDLVKEIADEVTTTNIEFGVARVVDRLLSR